MVELKKFQTIAVGIMFLLLGVVTSCNKDEEDTSSLAGTVWIHQFIPENNIEDGSAAALYFGKETVEYYALDNNSKVLRLLESLKYKIEGQKIIIGIKEGVLGTNYLTFKNERYYRSNKNISDMLTPQ